MPSALDIKVLKAIYACSVLSMMSANDAMECLKCTDILHNVVARILARTQVKA